ncbi:MAG: hypothetical protein QG628_499 [Patescibacteria group bacterium]|nr:hypothetical protein [Patescibacteria group bacterium]
MNTHETLERRRELVIDTLRPDELRDHRVADGIEVNPELLDTLDDAAKLISVFATQMGSLSNDALNADPKDKTMGTVRQLLGTESIFQAIRRGEIVDHEFSEPRFSKADLVFTQDGIKIVEIEPGKLRGMGYGVMVRHQNPYAIGIGAQNYFDTLQTTPMTAIIMSEKDRFHIPEISVLERSITPVFLTTQDELRLSSDQIFSRGREIAETIMMSPLTRAGIGEILLRRCVEVTSDRREDIESKGALAIIHNAGEDEQLEDLLRSYFSSEDLAALRNAIPLTLHKALLSPSQLESVIESIRQGQLAFFGKPLSDSGTRGILTPDESAELCHLLKSKHGRKIVLQEAEDCLARDIESMGVLSGDLLSQKMNLRLTIHVSEIGEIIESTVVGSNHDYLAHGGKSSVITELKAAI